MRIFTEIFRRAASLPERVRKMAEHDEGSGFRPCVGIALFNRRGEVWAGRRFHKAAALNSDEQSLWQLPQGGIEAGEEPLAAARRELWEETGIKAARLLAEVREWLSYELPEILLENASQRARPFRGRYRGQRQKWFAFLYEGDESEVQINPPPKSDEVEFDAWEWRDLSDVAAHIVEFKRPVYAVMAAEFAPIAEKLRAGEPL